MSGFTPGPWLIHASNRVVVRADGAFNQITVKDGKVEGDELPYSICLLRDPDEDFSEDETLANGFLISAAPELYADLAVILKAFGDVRDHPLGKRALETLARAVPTDPVGEL